ncbi:hypothetical protein JHW43_001263 [Diplocarpon mali]|nr:hypothetical protein JHW43_001263 [Diplocarpon mali]
MDSIATRICKSSTGLCFPQICSLGLGCATVSIFERFRTPAWRPYRAGMFVLMGLSAVFPVFHGLELHGFKDMQNRIGLTWLLCQGSFYVLGAVLYAILEMAQRVAQIAGHLNYPNGLLAGQVAIITGSGQGIGAEAARLFAKEGAKVIVSDIDAAKASQVADNINKSGGKALSVAGDMLDAEYVKTLVKKAAEFGNGKIHIILTTRQIYVGWRDTQSTALPMPLFIRYPPMTDKQWENILALHSTAPFKLVREAAPYFRITDGEPRCIINISSTSGVHGNAGQANYGLAKAGVNGLTKVIAKEWGPKFGVRANSIAFGHILTRLTAAKENGAFVTTSDGEKISLGIPAGQGSQKKDAHADIPLGRPGTATEAAQSILAVASPLFSYITGQVIMVTGGRNM